MDAAMLPFSPVPALRRISGYGDYFGGYPAFCHVLFTINVGDSRMYLITNGQPEQITHDHSYVQYLVDMGKMTQAEARKSVNRNIITRAVGTDNTVEADVYVTRLLGEKTADSSENDKAILDNQYIVLLCIRWAYQFCNTGRNCRGSCRISEKSTPAVLLEKLRRN